MLESLAYFCLLPENPSHPQTLASHLSHFILLYPSSAHSLEQVSPCVF